jgi:phage I-like protein
VIDGKPIHLLALRVPPSNGALAGEKLPARLKLLDWGENKTVKGPVRVSDLSVSLLQSNQSDRGFAEVALDFEHNTVRGSPEFERTTEPRPVAAYGIPRVIAGEGLFLENLRWTPAGKKDALNYADLSPAVELDAEGNIIFIHSAALVRNGAVDGLSFFSVTVTTQQKKSMSEKYIALAALSAALGLDAAADEAAVLAKLKERLAPPAVDLTPLSALIANGKIILLETVSSLDCRLKKIEEAGTKQIATLSATVDGKIVTLTAEDVVRLSARLDAAEQKLKDQAAAATGADQDRIISLFTAEGKAPINAATGIVYTADELKKLDLATLRLLQANTPVTVPLNARGRKPVEGKNFSQLKGLEKAIAAHQAGQ